MPALFVPFEVGIGQGQAQKLGLWNRLIYKFLAQLVVGLALDTPRHALGGIGALVVAWAKHHQRRPPPAVEGILGHGFLLLGSARQMHHELVTLTLVKALLLADANHRTAVGAVRSAAQHHLVLNRGSVNQPTHSAHVGPSEGRVVENAGILCLAGVQIVDHLVARRSEGLRRRVEVEAVAGFILNLGQQNELGAKRGSTRDPVRLRKHPNNLRVSMLANLTHERLAVGVGHPMFGLHLIFGRNVVEEAGFHVNFGGHGTESKG